MGALDVNWDRRCESVKSDGTPCKARAIRGGNVCRAHGGASGHVRAKAEERLEEAKRLLAEELLPEAMMKLRAMLNSSSDTVALRASLAILDRAGIAPPAQLDVTLHQANHDLDAEIDQALIRVKTASAGELEAAQDIDADLHELNPRVRRAVNLDDVIAEAEVVEDS